MAVLKASLRLCDLDALNVHQRLAWETSTEQRLSHYRPYITSHFINAPCTFSGKHNDETKRATFELRKLWCYSKCPTVHTLQTTCNRPYAERQIWVKDEAIRRWRLSCWLLLTPPPPPQQLSLTTTWKGCESHSTKIHLSTVSGWWSFNLRLSDVTKEKSHMAIFHYKLFSASTRLGLARFQLALSTTSR